MKIESRALSAAVFMSLLLNVACAADGEADVWRCARASADALIYFDSAQAERMMEPKLWAKIKADKKKGDAPKARKPDVEADEDDGGMDLALFEKDARFLANIDIVSRSPFRLAVSGGLSFSADERSVLSNIVSFVAEIVKDGDGTCLQSGAKGHSVQEFSMKLEEGDPIRLKVEESGDGFASFELLYNLESRPASPAAVQPPLSRQQAIERVRGGDLALGVVLNTTAWADLMTGKNREMRVMRRLFRAMDTAEIRVRVQGLFVELEMRGAFKSPALAQRYSDDILEALPKIKEMLGGGILVDLTPGVSGSNVTISAKVRLDLAWETLMKVQDNIGSDQDGGKTK